jgi:Domain of unknown function (DUF4265)
MNDQITKKTELRLALEVEDGWPPVAIERIPCSAVAQDFRVDAPPLFVKNLSVGDIIEAELDSDENVFSWRHVYKSKRTTIWLLRQKRPFNMQYILEKLHSLRCNTVELEQFGCYSIDVPEDCEIDEIDKCLALLDSSKVAVAYPSFRHNNS